MSVMFLRISVIGVFVITLCSGDSFDDILNKILANKPAQFIAESSDSGKPSSTSQETDYTACGENRRCVPTYMCSTVNRTFDGLPIIDVRLEAQTTCRFLETCCLKRNIVSPSIVNPTEPPNGCGVRNLHGVGFRIDGATGETEFGEFPWMVAILHVKLNYSKEINVYQCGASLIHPDVVMTGAHCVYDLEEKEIKVRAGDWDTNSGQEIYPHQNRNVKQIVIHENYDRINLYNNIALLFLDKPFEIAPNVNTICLPAQGYEFDFQQCFATGWGKDKFENGEYQSILKKIQLPIVPNSICQDNLRLTRLGKYFWLHSSFLCAGGEQGKDTCKGDGGSPLVCPINSNGGRYYQAGMVAWGIGCGRKDIPGVYVNVPRLRKWIDDQLMLKDIVLEII